MMKKNSDNAELMIENFPVLGSTATDTVNDTVSVGCDTVSWN